MYLKPVTIIYTPEYRHIRGVYLHACHISLYTVFLRDKESALVILSYMPMKCIEK